MLASDLEVADGAWAEWLPQETILFDRAHLTRRTRAVARRSGRLLAGESTAAGPQPPTASGADAGCWRTWRRCAGATAGWPGRTACTLAPRRAALRARRRRFDARDVGAWRRRSTRAPASAAATWPAAREIAGRCTLAAGAGPARSGPRAAGLLLVRVLAATGRLLRRTVAGFWADFRAPPAGLPAPRAGRLAHVERAERTRLGGRRGRYEPTRRAEGRDAAETHARRTS
ncbi:MAG: hypothetical protein U5L06_02310 [Rhodovibrio sp.]|nr:hypothetical protein [Rhodovibrio sp.]